MNFEDKISRIAENQKIKKKLNELGIYAIQGPTGPRGTGINISGSYNTEEELISHHPTGKAGDCYIVNGILYVWDIETNEWENSGNIQGPTGISEKIKIINTKTGESGTQAQVIDNFNGKEHLLEFIIPKGEQGLKGDKGDIGISESIIVDNTETVESDKFAEVHDNFNQNIHHLTFYIPKGDKGEIGPTGPAFVTPTSYDSVLFASFAQANYSRIMVFQETIEIPENNNFFELSDNSNITLTQPGIYEITLCGQISGVDQNHGAIFYLSNADGAVIQDLSFEVKAGTTTRMDCSETIMTKLHTATTVYVRCGITGDNSTANIDFTNVNLIIKKYHIDQF